MKLYQDPSWLYQCYWENGLTTHEMADRAGCTQPTICYWMKQHSIPRRHPTGILGLSVGERFWSKVNVRGDDECWEWLAGKDKDGYGRFKVSMSKGHERAHRFAWALINGLVPKDLLVCHCCDNPPCCNPSHLFLGTNADNMADRDHKGRGARGAAVGTARLARDDVLKIRQIWEETDLYQREIAARFGVSQRTISLIVRRESWAWL